MEFNVHTFLTHVKALVVGGGRELDGVTPRNDAGYLHDMNYSLNDVIVPITDSSGGTAGTTLAANAFKQTISIPLGSMSLLVNSQNFKVPVPFAFTLTGTPSFRADVAITTGAKAVTLTTNINTTPTTGGIISVAGTYATGVAQAASAAFSALNTGVAGDFINVITSSVTAFVEGTGHVEFTVINNDLANAAATLAASLNTVASETNLKVNSYAASTTNIGTLNVVIPRDYDEATDTFTVHMGLAMSGSTDTPAFTATAYRKRPGSSIATVATSVSGKLRSGTAAAGSSADQVVVFDFSRNGLLMDDALTIVFTSGAHTTDAVLQYYVQPVYRSTLVAYHESTGGTRDGKDGAFLR